MPIFLNWFIFKFLRKKMLFGVYIVKSMLKFKRKYRDLMYSILMVTIMLYYIPKSC